MTFDHQEHRSYQPDMKRVKAKAPITTRYLAFLRQYFSMASADTLLGLTFEEKIWVKRIDEHLEAKDSWFEALKLLEREAK